MPKSSKLVKKGIPEIPEHWENYLLCILLHMMLPLLPLFLEYWLTNVVSEKSMTLSAAMYTISIGISSKSKFIFGLTIVSSILFAAAFGIVVGKSPEISQLSGGGEILSKSTIISLCGIVIVFFLHLLERFNKHIIDRNPFLEFSNKEQEMEY